MPYILLKERSTYWTAVAVTFLFMPFEATAATSSVCAEVHMDIAQAATMERQAFDAHMRITNGLSQISLESIGVTLSFFDSTGNPILADSNSDNTEALFYVSLESLNNIDAVDGSGSVAPSTTADAHWLIIPAQGAASGLTDGSLYYVGGTLAYSLAGEVLSTELTPDAITVAPMPDLTLDYFLPSDVHGDDPFTTEVEPSEPFNLGLRVTNAGPGAATNLKVESAIPTITENEQGLLINFTLESSEVNGVNTSPSLLTEFGDVASGSAATARWVMNCTLSGRFTAFSASLSHSDALGGEMTSLITAENTHTLVRDVLVDLGDRDLIKDFLAVNGTDYTLYESDGSDGVVTDLSASTTMQEYSPGKFSLQAPATSGFTFLQLPDPMTGQMVIKSIVRSDGKIISPENGWLSKIRDIDTWDYFFNLFDTNTPGSYTVTYTAEAGNLPPMLNWTADKLAFEQQLLSFTVSATDDTAVPTLSASPLPALAGFTDQGNGSALFSWTPAQAQAGAYQLTITASDGSLTASQPLTVSVVSSGQDADGDGMDDMCELESFGYLSRDGLGDFDGDGTNDHEECINGSDPAYAENGEIFYGSVLDMPHNESNRISCGDCHSYSLWFQYAPLEANSELRGQIVSAICTSCHKANDRSTAQEHHASTALGGIHNTSLGDWQTVCIDCHDSHYQAQLDWLPDHSAELYLATGTIGDTSSFVTQDRKTTFSYTLDFAKAAWNDPATWSWKNTTYPIRGLVLVVDTVNATNTMEVVAADDSTITVKGGLPDEAANSSFGLIYGQLIRSVIEAPGVIGSRDVRFFDPKDPAGGFTDSNTPASGICQVCHSQAAYWTEDGQGSTHQPTTLCTGCHPAAQGFLPVQ